MCHCSYRAWIPRSCAWSRSILRLQRRQNTTRNSKRFWLKIGLDEVCVKPLSPGWSREFILLSVRLADQDQSSNRPTSCSNASKPSLGRLICLWKTPFQRESSRLTKRRESLATYARSKILSGKRKAASSSLISASHFDSNARVALDLLAMRPSRQETERQPVDFEPSRMYISWLRYDSVTFVSGYTSELDRLEDQVSAVLGDIDHALKAASTSWNHVARLSVYVSRTQNLEVLKNLLREANRLELSNRIRIC